MVSLAELLLILAVIGMTFLSLIAVLRQRNGNGNGHVAMTLIEVQKAEINQLSIDMATWRELALRRAEQLERLGIVPAMRYQVETHVEIVKDLERKFSIEEMNALAFDIGIRPDSIPGETLAERARQLVLAADRRNKLMTLVEEIKRQRPE